MRFDTTTDYAIRILACLVVFPPARTTREIATQMRLSEKNVSDVLLKLIHIGWIQPATPKMDAYRLSVDPDEISLMDIVEAMEEPLFLDSDVEEDGYSYPFGMLQSPLQNIYDKIRVNVSRLLRDIPLSDVLAGKTGACEWDWCCADGQEPAELGTPRYDMPTRHCRGGFDTPIEKATTARYV
jgi:DNA-binding IscR family transcriptional regulator